MSRNRIMIAGMVVATVLLHACRRDPSPWTETIPMGPTPMSLDVPAWVLQAVGAPLLPADNPLTREGVDLGRRLFFEKALSDDFSLSCASCHLPENAFSDPRVVSLGTDGSPGRRNSMAIINAAWDHFFFRDGRSTSLEDQALRPVVDHAEMRNTWPTVVQRLQAHPHYPGLFKAAFGTAEIDSMRVVKAIAQFERTLLSFNSRFDRWFYGGDATALTEQEQRGFDLFMNAGHCHNCHAPPLFHDNDFRNIGLDQFPADGGRSEVTGFGADKGRYKTTTLRNIAQTAPYMHDGRFATLEEVMDFYADDVVLTVNNLDPHMFPWIEGEIDLSPQDRADLVAFMLALTDDGFLSNPAFQDPH